MREDCDCSTTEWCGQALQIGPDLGWLVQEEGGLRVRAVGRHPLGCSRSTSSELTVLLLRSMFQGC
jgi:hypothetical protein